MNTLHFYFVTVLAVMIFAGCGGHSPGQPEPDAGMVSCVGEEDGTICVSPGVDPCIERGVCELGVCKLSVAPSGTACGDPMSNDCTMPDTCDGAGKCQANHTTEGEACGDSINSDCTRPDSCDGAGNCQANHEPSSTACGERSSTECSEPDVCDGNGICAPNHKLAGTACGDNTDTQCTNPDTCDGAGICIDNHATDGMTCNDCPGGTGCDACFAGACTSACTSPQLALTTLFANEDFYDGVMFDVTAGQTDVKITSLDVNLRPTATPHNVEIYYRPGSYMGFDGNSSGWTSAGRAEGISSNGENESTPIPLSLGIAIPSGETYGFYVATAGSGGIYFSAGSQEGRVYASDANISVKEGIIVGYPFLGRLGTVYVFNGTVHYQTCAP